MKKTQLLQSMLLATLSVVGLLIVLHSTEVSAAPAPVTEERANESATPLAAQDVFSTAYVVVRFGDHDTIVRPVTFTQPISAYHALELSGLAFTTADFGYGLFLCSIEDVGDSSGACDNGDRFWGAYEWDGAAWMARMVGIGDAMIEQDGHVEGFSWSDPGWSMVDPPPAPPLVAASRALGWLRTRQQADGGFGTPGSTADVLIALGANRVSGSIWRAPNGPTVLSNMLGRSRTLANSGPAGAGKLAVALTAHDTCWPHAALQPSDYYSPTTGAFHADAGPHALGMLGTAALSETVPPSATFHLLALQQANGGWEWGVGWGADTNSTALAVQALVAAGEPLTSTAIISALNYLDQAQNDDGGFPYDPQSPWGTDSDTNSTAYVVQALLAAGQDPLTGTWAISDTNPIEFLLSMQLEDGSFEWQAGFGSNQVATQQAIPALLYRPLPVRRTAMDVCRPAYLPLVKKG